LIDLQDVADCGATVTICSTLGDAPPPLVVDDDVYSFTGMTGEDVTITLESVGSGSGSVDFTLIDASGESVDPVLSDRSELPSQIVANLPATGEYRIGVVQWARLAFIGGTKFSGDYCLTVDASQGAAQTLVAGPSVEGSAAAAAEAEQPDDDSARERAPAGRDGTRDTKGTTTRTRPTSTRRRR
jgi:hypothetical protein